MKAIKDKVVRQDLPGIADEMLAMQRLWNKRELPGLYRRRGAEADLVRKADRFYLWPELIYI
jgi:GH24 family phage-related lysozyme (muramidase)